MGLWAENPENHPALSAVDGLLKALKPLPLGLDLWKSQNIYVLRGRQVQAGYSSRAAIGEAAAQDWLEAFRAAGKSLRVSQAVFQPASRPA